MKRIIIIIIAFAFSVFASAQKGRYNKGRRPVRTSQRVTPRPTIKTCPDNNHPHAIDLGLPSGTKWACCNVGSEKPERYGNYYAYGETGTKSNYDVDTYEWSDDWDLTEYGIYHNLSARFDTDEFENLDLAYDAANVNWHGEWSMPKIENLNELIENTTYKWVNNFNGTGVNGALLTASNGNCIFFPAAGWRNGMSLDKAGSECRYWSSSGSTNNQYIAWCLGFDSGGEDYYEGKDRTNGLSVRAVCNETISLCPDGNHPHVIDMGEAGKWACCNVGASKPEEFGDYFAWGETTSKSKYDWDTYAWGSAENELTKYCADSDFGKNDFTDNKYTLDLADDAAHANWGNEWRMPTSKDFENLLKYTNNKWVENYNGKGMNAWLFIASNGNRILLPAAGTHHVMSLCSQGTGDYWSSSLCNDNPHYPYRLGYYPGDVRGYYDRNRQDGRSVRPVLP